MNLIILVMLMLFTLICMFFIPNKSIAASCVLLSIIILILINPEYFKINIDTVSNTCSTNNYYK